MYIANSLHVRVSWPIEGGASFVDLQLILQVELDPWKRQPRVFIKVRVILMYDGCPSKS